MNDTQLTGRLRPRSITKDELADMAELFTHSDLRTVPEGLTLQRLRNAANNSQIFVSCEMIWEGGLPIRQRIVGMATLAVITTLHGTEGHITDVVVLDRCRGQGRGWKLLHELLNAARAAELDRVVARVEEGRPNAERLLMDLGFSRTEPHAFTMRLR